MGRCFLQFALKSTFKYKVQYKYISAKYFFYSIVVGGRNCQAFHVPVSYYTNGVNSQSISQLSIRSGLFVFLVILLLLFSGGGSFILLAIYVDRSIFFGAFFWQYLVGLNLGYHSRSAYSATLSKMEEAPDQKSARHVMALNNLALSFFILAKSLVRSRTNRVSKTDTHAMIHQSNN